MHDIETKIGSPQLLKNQVGFHDLRHGTVHFEILGLDLLLILFPTGLLKILFTKCTLVGLQKLITRPTVSCTLDTHQIILKSGYK